MKIHKLNSRRMNSVNWYVIKEPDGFIGCAPLPGSELSKGDKAFLSEANNGKGGMVTIISGPYSSCEEAKDRVPNSRQSNSDQYEDLYERLVSEFPNLTVTHEGDLENGGEEFIEIFSSSDHKVADITIASGSNEFDPRRGYYVIGFKGRQPKQSDDLRDIISLVKDYFGESNNSRNSRLNSRQSNSNPEIWESIDVAVSKIFVNSQDRTSENASLTVQALFAALSQYFPNLGGLKQVFIDAVNGNNQYLNSRFHKNNFRRCNSSSKFWIVAHPDTPTDEGETVWVGPYDSRDEAYDRLNESGLKSSYPETEDTYGTNISIMTTEELLPFTERERRPGFSLDRMAWNFWDFVKLHQDTYGVNSCKSNSRIHRLNSREPEFRVYYTLNGDSVIKSFMNEADFEFWYHDVKSRHDEFRIDSVYKHNTLGEYEEYFDY